MSATLTEFDKMGFTNNFWGVCGINSSLYALYQNNAEMRSRLLTGALTPSMILAEIKTFLRICQAEGKQDILNAITAFTKSFEGFESFSIQSYIERINTAPATVASGGQTALLDDPKFSIAMPPDAVVFYLTRMCGLANAKLVGKDTTATELVLGLFRDDGNNMKIYDGLRHYVYYRNGTYYSWGKQFASIDQMKKKYGGICYRIAF